MGDYPNPGSLLLPTTCDPARTTRTVPTLGADLSPAAVESALAPVSSLDPSAASADLASLYDQYIYTPVYDFSQNWIDGTTVFGSGTVTLDTDLNTFWTDIGGTGELIGNGGTGDNGGT